MREGENPPVGLILCSEKDEALARYALEGLSSNVLAAEYRIALPDETVLAAELDRTRQAMEQRADSLRQEAGLFLFQLGGPGTGWTTCLTRGAGRCLSSFWTGRPSTGTTKST